MNINTSFIKLESGWYTPKKAAEICGISENNVRSTFVFLKLETKKMVDNGRSKLFYLFPGVENIDDSFLN